jgi:hypothetical protein
LGVAGIIIGVLISGILTEEARDFFGLTRPPTKVEIVPSPPPAPREPLEKNPPPAAPEKPPPREIVKPTLNGGIRREVAESLVGEYNAGSTMVRVALSQGGVLTYVVPGQPVYELNHDRDLRFSVKDVPSLSIEFRRDTSGAIAELVSHQANGAAVAVRPSGERISVDVLRRLAGVYEAGAVTMTVALNPNGALTAAVPGTGTLELIFVRGLRFMLSGSAGASVEFHRSRDGDIAGFTLVQLSGRYNFQRRD